MKADKENVCEQKVFNELFKKLSSDLYRFLYYKFGPANNPRDIVQEAFAALWQNCEKVTISKAKSYLFTVANNKVLNDLDRKKTALTYRNENPTDKDHTDTESPEFVIEEKEYMNRLQKALNELSEDQRVTFMMNRVEGKKHKEIAEILGISRKAVEKRIYKALDVLREKLGDFDR
ncbi:RNA polymerase sigma factor [Ekhidna sp.]|uniref:RNA polymerase sigma factor n=1 Tax=Ekhidna sp. TaxID=2608089 RepID=UPI003B5B8545